MRRRDFKNERVKSFFESNKNINYFLLEVERIHSQL